MEEELLRKRWCRIAWGGVAIPNCTSGLRAGSTRTSSELGHLRVSPVVHVESDRGNIEGQCGMDRSSANCGCFEPRMQWLRTAPDGDSDERGLGPVRTQQSPAYRLTALFKPSSALLGFRSTEDPPSRPGATLFGPCPGLTGIRGARTRP